MKDLHIRAKAISLALSLLFTFSFAAKADEAADFLSNLHEFRVNNFVALDAYYRFTVDGNTDALNEIVTAINSANTSMSTVSDSTAEVLAASEIENLNQEFDKFKNLVRLNINDVRQSGYPDLRLVSEMADQAAILNNRASDMYNEALESSQVSSNDKVEAARLASVTMAQMMAKYSVRSNMSVSQTFQGSSDDTPLDQKAQQFENLLGQLSAGPNSGPLKTTLEGIKSKWSFIKNSYINYNENNVSFVIDRYSKGILEDLATTIDLLQQSA
ncbi:hypothetical protein [Marinobacter mobilis]|uniref:Type IV pili methyl-accepting chemotaxis transducer N-term n=1 Tax=Marinobacter mobilis TaxID=488533 RepID=A0A1H3BN86_9GAMM|nr:hypothetical protein [Marinobacter mobilis]SDX43462.1 hypothetical protein SAMN04487960_109100 [Marinobacter mobilis]